MLEGLIGAISGLLGKIIDKIPFKRKSSPPKQTVRLVLKPHNSWWHMGKEGKKPAMQVTCRWHVTNITSNQVIITTAFIKKPRTDAAFPAVKHPNQNVYGTYPILPKATTELVLHFWVLPPSRKKGEVFSASIVVKDQFGNEHKIRKVRFEYR